MGAMDVMKTAEKTYGKGTAGLGVRTYESVRCPTGIFELDLGLNGGMPYGKLIEIYGPESSGKTNLVLAVIKQLQHRHPGMYVVFIDVEGGLEGAWVKRWGIDPEFLIVVNPDYAEQAVDLAEKFINAEDVCGVFVDSLAAMVATAEIEKSAEGVIVAGNSQVVQKLVRKVGIALNTRRKAYENGETTLPPPMWVCVNQIRTQIGVMFGSPEKTPGGWAPKFWAALRIRCYGKNVVDKKVSAVMPVAKHTNIIVQKWKVPINATHIEYEMVMLAHDGLTTGQTKDWNLVEKRLKELGYLAKAPGSKGGWEMFGETYQTLVDCREKYYADADFQATVRQGIIEMEKPDALISVEGELVLEDEVAPEEVNAPK